MQVTFDKIKIGQMFKYARAIDQTVVFLKEKEWEGSQRNTFYKDGVTVRARVVHGTKLYPSGEMVVSYWKDTTYEIVEPEFKVVEVEEKENKFEFSNGLSLSIVPTGVIAHNTGQYETPIFKDEDINKLRRGLSKEHTLGGYKVEGIYGLKIGCKVFDRDELRKAIEWYDENKS